MQNQSDAQLLRAYVETGQEAAFREIVTRHADLVYSAALGQVNSPALACDLARGVRAFVQGNGIDRDLLIRVDGSHQQISGLSPDLV